MGLFRKRKREEEKAELPPLKFPEFPVKTYKPQITPSEASAIRTAVKPDLDIPIRRPIMQQPIQVPKQATTASYREGRALFVKIDNFKRAMATMSEIKAKIREAEEILKKLDEIKQKEDIELTTWHNDLSSIKAKLLDIDKSLFEGVL